MSRSIIVNLLLAMFLCGLVDPFVGSSGTLPPYPLMSTRVQPSSYEQERAEALFLLARKENRRLAWDACLSRKAFLRAKEMAGNGYFAHRDLQTGENPAWEMVAQCSRYRYAAENLVKGYQSALVCHSALMKSSSHRANVKSPRHRFLGVGCYDNICVELFAGF